MTDTHKIHKGISLPVKTITLKWPFDKLSVGDCFVLDTADKISTVAAAGRSYAKRWAEANGSKQDEKGNFITKKFSIRLSKEIGLACWRVL